MYNTNYNYGNNPYYGSYVPQQLMYRQMLGLQGKTIDNLEAVKSADIMMDGSISYFPLADGTAIASKQLQQDGTSKIKIFKAVEENNTQTETEDIKSIKDDIEKIKEQINSLLNKEA
jgi:uncharacterized membrane protein YcaP (DUF421 family)